MDVNKSQYIESTLKLFVAGSHLISLTASLLIHNAYIQVTSLTKLETPAVIVRKMHTHLDALNCQDKAKLMSNVYSAVMCRKIAVCAWTNNKIKNNLSYWNQ